MTLAEVVRSVATSVAEVCLARSPGAFRSPAFSPFSRLSNLPMLAVLTPAR